MKTENADFRVLCHGTNFQVWSFGIYNQSLCQQCVRIDKRSDRLHITGEHEYVSFYDVPRLHGEYSFICRRFTISNDTISDESRYLCLVSVHVHCRRSCSQPFKDWSGTRTLLIRPRTPQGQSAMAIRQDSAACQIRWSCLCFIGRRCRWLNDWWPDWLLWTQLGTDSR